MSSDKDMEQKQQRILWIDGLRGLGCLCIFFHHYCLKYYPATYYGLSGGSRIRWGLDAKLADLPFFFLLNGNFWVCIYLVISGMMMAYKKTGAGHVSRTEYFLKNFLKRYLTLLPPILISEILVYIGNRLYPDAILPAVKESLPFWQYLKSSFFSVFFTCDRKIIGSLWTMQPIFLGGLLILFIRIWVKNEKIQLVLLALLSVFCLQAEVLYYFVPVLTGGILAMFISPADREADKKRGWFFLAFGSFLAAYPSGLVPDGIYALLPSGRFAVMGYHLIGALLFICGIMYIKWFRNLFSAGCFLWLGRISFSFYVFHEVLIKTTNVWKPVIEKVIASYFLQVSIMAVAALAILFLVTALYVKLLEPVWKKLLAGIDVTGK